MVSEVRRMIASKEIIELRGSMKELLGVLEMFLNWMVFTYA